jgi:hypothetical protein
LTVLAEGLEVIGFLHPGRLKGIEAEAVKGVGGIGPSA